MRNLRIASVTYFVLFLFVNILNAQKLENLRILKQQSKNELFSKLGVAKRGAGFAMDGYWVWCSSVIKGDDHKYHMFASRWKKSIPFHPGWMTSSEVVHAVTDQLEGPYTFSDVSLPARGAEYWDGRSTHNPRILKYKDKYVLYYVGSTHPFEEPTFEELTLDSKWCIVGRSNKRVGVAIADSPYGPWKRFDKPVLDAKPNTFYSFLTSNPSPVLNEDGSVLLVFKARNYVGNNAYSDMCLGIAKAKSIYDEFTVLNNNEPILGARNKKEVEDPFFWKDDKGYHMIFKDHVAKYTGEKGGGALAHSMDAIHWEMDKDPKAYSRTVEWNDGTIEMMGQLERPFIFFENGKPAYLFFATMDGPGGFENATRSWAMVIPFVE